MSAKGSERILELQSLRFFAAFLVVVGHVLMEMRQHGSSVNDLIYDLPWGGGVDIFFIISGFVIYYIGVGRPSGALSALDFMSRRIIRIAPLYWLFTFLMIISIVSVPQSVSASRPGISEIVKSLFFIPYGPLGAPYTRPILAQGWTLNYEFFFYLIFAFSLLLPRYRLAVVLTALLTFAVLGEFSVFPPVVQLLLSPFLLLFAAGMLLARFRDSLPTHGTAVALMLFLGGLLAAGLMPIFPENDIWMRLLTRGVPSMAMVYAVLRWRAAPKWITTGAMPLLGDASYALYLSHPFVVNVLLIIFEKTGLPISNLFFGVATAGAIVASVVIYFVVERPLLKFGNAGYKRATSGLFGKKATTAPAEAR